MKYSFFKGELGDLTDEISTRAKNKSREKTKLKFILNFYWKSKFGFENQKNFKIQFHFKTKMEFPF